MDACATTRASGVLKVKTISKCVVAVLKRLHSVCTRRGPTLGRSPFKRKWTQKERSTLEAS